MSKGSRSRSPQRETTGSRLVIKQSPDALHTNMSHPQKQTAKKVVTSQSSNSNQTSPSVQIDNTKNEEKTSNVTTFSLWISAFTRSIPSCLIAYICFILIITTSSVLATVLGFFFCISGLLLYVLVRDQKIILLRDTQWQAVEQWMGHRYFISLSLLVFGLSTLIWSIGDKTGSLLFLRLPLMLMTIALGLIVYGQYKILPGNENKRTESEK
jgi:uncharacterized iron-regulated membrane protein